MPSFRECINAQEQGQGRGAGSAAGLRIRRLQQIAVAIFLEETQAQGITPVQYAALFATQQQPGLDERTLAGSIKVFDTSTIGGVIDRLEKRGLIERQASPTDRRVRLLQVTPAGQALLDEAIPVMLKAQQRIWCCCHRPSSGWKVPVTPRPWWTPTTA